MIDQSPNERLLFRYLLGQASEEERAQIEEQFIEHDERFNELLLVEDELRCAYAQGALSPADREQFEKRFLIFPDERHRVALAGSMIAELFSRSAKQASETVPARPKERSNWKAFLALFRLRTPTFGLASVAMAMLVVLVCGWLMFRATKLQDQVTDLQAKITAKEQEIERRSAEQRSRAEKLTAELEDERNSRTLLEQELAQQRSSGADKEEVRPSIFSAFLLPGLTRGEGETKKLTIPGNTTDLRILLNLGDKRGFRGYQATLINAEGEQVWSRRSLRASEVRGGHFIVLRIPARVLAEDDYEIELTGLSDTGQLDRIGNYHFTLIKK